MGLTRVQRYYAACDYCSVDFCLLQWRRQAWATRAKCRLTTTLTVKHIGQGPGGDLCDILLILIVSAVKICKHVCKLLQLLCPDSG